MKHIYSLLFLLAAFGEGHAQCSSNIKVTGNGRGGYAFDTLKAQSGDIVGTYLITMNDDTLLVDSNTLHSSFDFHVNGTYRICLHIKDTITLCESDTCKDLLVEDAEYHKLLEEVNRWHMNLNYCLVLKDWSRPINSRSICQHAEDAEEIFTDLDTTINNLVYKKVMTEDPYTIADFCLIGFIREDTLMRKVFYWDGNDVAEKLLYDFSIEEGDTVRLEIKAIGYYTDSVFIVDSVKLQGTYNGIRRVFYTHQLHNAIYPLVWVEGVGHLGHPLYSALISHYGSCPSTQCMYDPYVSMIPLYYPSTVTCFYHDEIAYFDSCNYHDALTYETYCFAIYDSCSYGWVCGAIHEINALNAIDISPNPSHGSVTLKLDVVQSSEFEIIIHDLQGRKAFSNYKLGRLSAGIHSQQLDVSQLSSGFYLLECRNHEGSVFKKLVVDRE